MTNNYNNDNNRFPFIQSLVPASEAFDPNEFIQRITNGNGSGMFNDGNSISAGVSDGGYLSIKHFEAIEEAGSELQAKVQMLEAKVNASSQYETRIIQLQNKIQLQETTIKQLQTTAGTNPATSNSTTAQLNTAKAKEPLPSYLDSNNPLNKRIDSYNRYHKNLPGNKT